MYRLIPLLILAGVIAIVGWGCSENHARIATSQPVTVGSADASVVKVAAEMKTEVHDVKTALSQTETNRHEESSAQHDLTKNIGIQSHDMLMIVVWGGAIQTGLFCGTLILMSYFLMLHFRSEGCRAPR